MVINLNGLNWGTNSIQTKSTIMDFNSFKKKVKVIHIFSIKNNKVFTHIKFNTFPDGGVTELDCMDRLQNLKLGIKK